MSNKRKILIIDDENDIRNAIQSYLVDKFQVFDASDGEEGLRKAKTELPDLILLDISMPKLDGLSVCEDLRSNEATRHIPIIMLTAASDTSRRIDAFMTGADDYLSKPFRMQELVARVQSKMRRIQERETKEENVACGNLVMNVNKLEALINDALIPLSVLEFNLLRYLVLNRDRVLSREKILEAVWRDTSVSDRTVDTHIVSLRKKLADFDHSLTTVYGAGYILKKN